MQIRKLLNSLYRSVMCGLVALSVTSSAQAIQGLHYGVRTEVVQPIYAFGSWFWYSSLHTQIPSLDKHPHFWLVSLSSGVRGILTPYFIFGVYGSVGQLSHHFGKSYVINPGIECWFPWAKLGIHAYFMTHKAQSGENFPSIEQSACIKQAIDLKLSGTVLPFVRPFLAAYYLSKFKHDASLRNEGSLHFSWGVEWLITPQCSLEAQNDIGESNLLVRIKLHSAKVRQPHKNTRVVHYLQEPIDQYTLPIMLLSPDRPDQAIFWAPASTSIQPLNILSPRPSEAVKPSYSHYGNAADVRRQRAASFSFGDGLTVHHPEPSSIFTKQPPQASTQSTITNVQPSAPSLFTETKLGGSQTTYGSDASRSLPPIHHKNIPMPGVSGSVTGEEVRPYKEGTVVLEGTGKYKPLSLKKPAPPCLGRAQTVGVRPRMVVPSFGTQESEKIPSGSSVKSVTFISPNNPTKIQRPARSLPVMYHNSAKEEDSIKPPRNSLMSPTEPLPKPMTNPMEDSLPRHAEPGDLR